MFIDGNYHEVFRAPYAGRLRNIYVQALPDNTRRLWVNFGAHVVWVPLSLNPFNDPNYHFIWEGHLISAWYYGGMKDVIKMWNTIKLFLENVSPDHRFVKADYQLDDPDDAWTEIEGAFDTLPVEELELDTSNPPTTTGRRFRYRLRMYTDDREESPRLKAVVVQAIGGAPVKYGYTWTFALADGDMALDLEGTEDTTFTSSQAFATQLDSWARNATPLYMEQRFSIFSGQNVKIDPAGLQPHTLDENIEAGKGREKYYAQITVLEL